MTGKRLREQQAWRFRQAAERLQRWVPILRNEEVVKLIDELLDYGVLAVSDLAMLDEIEKRRVDDAAERILGLELPAAVAARNPPVEVLAALRGPLVNVLRSTGSACLDDLEDALGKRRREQIDGDGCIERDHLKQRT